MSDLALLFESAEKVNASTQVRPAELESVFSRIEQTVIALGRSDSPSTRRDTRFGLMMERLFGIQPATRLADPRLEALRRMALLLTLSQPALEAEEVDAFLARGFSWEQLLALAGGRLQHVN